jgi:hypothetical protein
MTVGIYARVSTALQENGNQLDSLREFAHKQGWKVTHEYVDVVSGSGKKTRPKFERMMDIGIFHQLTLWNAANLPTFIDEVEGRSGKTATPEGCCGWRGLARRDGVLWLIFFSLSASSPVP